MCLDEGIIILSIIAIYLLIGYIFKHSLILYYVLKSIKNAKDHSQYGEYDAASIKKTYKEYWNSDNTTDLYELLDIMHNKSPNYSRPWFDDSIAFFGVAFWIILLPIIIIVFIYSFFLNKFLKNVNPFIKILECATAEKCDLTKNLKENINNMK